MRYPQLRNSEEGLTLFEIMISMAILVVIGTFSFVIYSGYQRSVTLQTAVQSLKDYLRTAQTNASTRQDDRYWGVLFTNPTGTGGDKAELYSCGAGVACSGTGGTCASKTAPMKETYFLSSGVTFSTPGESSTVEICFDKVTGKRNGTDPKSVTIQLGSGDQRTVSVSAQGQIE